MSQPYQDAFKDQVNQNLGAVRKYDSGATRSPLGDKLRYEGFLSPLVLKRYAEYMHKHRVQSDGKLREPDNWQKGMPLGDYIDSGWRHVMDWWLHHRGYGSQASESLEESLCAILFNVNGYLLEILKQKEQLNAESRVSHWVATQPGSPKDQSSDPGDRK
jgi:hypothetical protein